MKLQANNLVVKSLKKDILNGVSFSIDMEKNVAIYGSDGSGKMALLLCLAGCLKPDNGSLYLDNINVYKNLDNYKKMVGLGEMKKINPLVDELTVEENIEYLCDMKREQYIAQDWIEKISLAGIGNYFDTPISECSAFTRSIIGCLCSLVGDPPLLFWDEPTGQLTSEQSRQFWTIMSKFWENKKIFFSTKKRMEIDLMSAKLIDLDQINL